MMDMKNISGIYALLDPDTKDIRYIGQSKNIHKRFVSHKNTKNDLPVSRWVLKLKEAGKLPHLQILVICDNPVDIEKEIIAKYKSTGSNLLNLHEGGRYPSGSQNGDSEKLWCVKGMKSPYLVLFQSFFPYIKTFEKVKCFFDRLAQEKSNVKSEYERVLFERKCAHIAINCGHNDVAEKAAKWVLSVKDRVNSKYPQTFVVI